MAQPPGGAAGRRDRGAVRGNRPRPRRRHDPDRKSAWRGVDSPTPFRTPLFAWRAKWCQPLSCCSPRRAPTTPTSPRHWTNVRGSPRRCAATALTTMEVPWAVIGAGFDTDTVTAQGLSYRQTRQTRGGDFTGHTWGLFVATSGDFHTATDTRPRCCSRRTSAARAARAAQGGPVRFCWVENGGR